MFLEILLISLFLWQEDDLFTMAYGLPLDGDGDEKCLSLLNAVEETISRQLRACKAHLSKRRVLEGSCHITCLNLFFLSPFKAKHCLSRLQTIQKDSS